MQNAIFILSIHNKNFTITYQPKKKEKKKSLFIQKLDIINTLLRHPSYCYICRHKSKFQSKTISDMWILTNNASIQQQTKLHICHVLYLYVTKENQIVLANYILFVIRAIFVVVGLIMAPIKSHLNPLYLFELAPFSSLFYSSNIYYVSTIHVCISTICWLCYYYN